jgi:hypothetical protein
METPDDCEAAAIERELGYCESRAHAEKRAARLSRSVEAVHRPPTPCGRIRFKSATPAMSRRKSPLSGQGIIVHRVIDITVPSNRGEQLIAALNQLEGVVGLTWQHGASIKPVGDVVTVHALNRATDDVMRAVADDRRRYAVHCRNGGGREHQRPREPEADRRRRRRGDMGGARKPVCGIRDASPQISCS